jgi:hypothetical protein
LEVAMQIVLREIGSEMIVPSFEEWRSNNSQIDLFN